MSEQLPIETLQFAAQLVPQLLNSPAASGTQSPADFRKFLLEQQVTVAGALQDKTQAGEGGVADGQLLALLATSTYSGNTLPQAGRDLQARAANPAALAFTQLAGQAGRVQGRLPGNTADPAILASTLSGEAEEQQAVLPQSLASRSLSESLASLRPQISTGNVPSVTSTVPQDEVADIDNLLQALTGNQQQAIRAAENQGEQGRLQVVQQVVSNVAQPQAAAITYNAVALPQATPPPAESGLLVSQPLQTVNIDVPVQSADWSRAFAERAVWLVNNQQSAQLRLTPASLGQIDIQVRVKDDEASIIFNTQNNVVKETVEASLPRLRDMLESQGLNLVNVNVNEGDSSGREAFTSVFDQGEPAEADEQQADLVELVNQPVTLLSSSAVDLYV